MTKLSFRLDYVFEIRHLYGCLFSKNHGEGFTPGAHTPGLKFERVQYRPQKSLDMLIEQFLASLRFEQRETLDQLGIEIGSFEQILVGFGSSLIPRNHDYEMINGIDSRQLY